MFKFSNQTSTEINCLLGPIPCIKTVGSLVVSTQLVPTMESSQATIHRSKEISEFW